MSTGANASIAQVQRHFHDALGRDCIRRLHREDRRIDAVAMLLIPGLFVTLAMVLGRLPVGPLWCTLVVVQGFVLMSLGLACHEWLHRGFPRGAWGRPASVLLMLPIYRSPTHYRFWHAIHHTQLGQAGDSEQFKRYIDNTQRRLFYATLLGEIFPRLIFPRRQGYRPPVQPDTSSIDTLVASEKRYLRLFTMCWIGLAAFFPREVLLGYVLPLALVTPFVSTVRTVIEHSEFDPRNPFAIGCFYRTTAVTRVLFFWNGGDCHFVHHVFPRLPFYRIPEALRLMRPIFLAQGVVEHRSLVRLTIQWFTQGRPYLGTDVRQT